MSHKKKPKEVLSVPNFSNNSAMEPVKELERNIKIPLHVIESCVSHCISQALTEETYQIISDFCSCRLIEVIKSANDFMKLNGSSKLTIKEFYQSLYVNDEASVLELKLLPHIGFENSTNQNAANDFIELSEISEQIELESKVSSCTKGIKRKRQTSSCRDKKNDLPSNDVHIICKWLNSEPFSPNVANVSPDLKKYFNAVTMVLLSKSENMCLKVINDLKTNNSILNLIPYFVNFFSSNLDKLNHDFLRASILLKALHSFLSNSCLHFNEKTISYEIVSTVVNFLTSDMPSSNKVCDYWLLKDVAACLLIQILNRSESKVLFLQIVYKLKSIFSDFSKSLESHYGAIVGLNLLGVPAVMLAISPHIDDYIESINIIYESNIEKRHCVNMIQGQLIQSYHLLISHYFKYEYFDSYCLNVQHYTSLPSYYVEFLKNDRVFPFLSQSKHADIFGDRLVLYFPLSIFIAYNVNNSVTNSTMNHFLNEENHHLSISSPKSSVTPVSVSKHTFHNNVKKYIRYRNLRRAYLSKKDLAGKNISVHDVKRQSTKHPVKVSREQVFEIIPSKKCVITFDKILS